LCDFESEFTKAIKEMENMMEDIPIEERLKILNNYENKFILKGSNND